VSSRRTALVWFRRDLRLHDNPALEFARAEADSVVPVFIWAPEEEAPWQPGAASRWWLHRSLESLDESLRQKGSRLTVRAGSSEAELRALIAETGATVIVWNRLYEPATIERDRRIKASLRAEGIEVTSHNAALLLEPWEIQTAQGHPYKVFTPFWRTAQARLPELPKPKRAPSRIEGPAKWPRSLELASLDLLPRIRWDTGLAETWTPGEPGAHSRLKSFARSRLAKYGNERDRPDHAGTSSLSPHLHFGEIGPRQILAALSDDAEGRAGREAYERELGWREFAHHLLFHFPQTPDVSLDQRFETMRWRGTKKQLGTWQRGATGIPLVDAGMRELWHTGWMHNRVRMIVASFLTKNIGMHWREGARWFWDALVDADLANNTLGWQWVAGCGADAAPYFRVFNPLLQAEKFDPDGVYVNRWIPELTSGGYSKPIVDLAESRVAALAVYNELRK
jgi:deoxyribodipyrimidine photo-lyase